MTFILDERIASSTFPLINWPLSTVLLKDNIRFPWFILVPRRPDIQAIDALSQKERYQLMDEISQLSSIVRLHFKPDKLNIGTLGNIVSQLHIHVVARFKEDDLWPHGVWQEALQSTPYPKNLRQSLLDALKPLL